MECISEYVFYRCVRCLHNRTREIISMQDNLQKEVDHLARVLKQSGYPANFIHNASAPPTQETPRHKHAAVMKNRRRRDHWWRYPMWLG